jgi:hypothetical protein
MKNSYVRAVFGLFTAFSSALAMSRPATANDLIVSEILTANSRTLQDEDGAYPDWIEIHNRGSTPVNLDGWSLTDNPANLRKWRFPAMELPAGGFLVVFASEKNRRTAGSELHTNFRLESAGEYLALVAPGGTQVVSGYAPKFPRQIEDVSYGLPMQTTSTVLLAAGAPARALVPADDGLGQSWIAPGFDDSGWISGTTGVGYDRKTTTTYTELIETNLLDVMSRVNSTAYIRIPFTAPEPSAIRLLRLRMKYDDGFVAYINGVEVARRSAPDNLAWNSRATVRRLDADGLVFENIDISAKARVLTAGTNLLAIHGLNISGTDTDFLILPEIEVVEIESAGAAAPVYFTTPTPGWPNGSLGAPGVAPDPQFSRASGTFTEDFLLTLSTTSPAAVIRYTLNRSEPAETSQAYTEPILINNTTAVRVKVFEAGLLPSPTASQIYTGLEPAVAEFSSNLPLMVVNTFGLGLSDGPFTPVYTHFIDTGNDRALLAGEAEYSGRGGLKWRGSSSLGFDKKNFAFEVWNEKNEDLDVSLIGFTPESDWILHGPYSDKSLMRNQLSYQWSNDLGRWAVRTKFIELFLNTGARKMRSTDYHGVYLFMEKIKRGKERVDIKPLYASESTEPGITGGYILKKDRLDPGDSGFLTSRGQRLAYVYPKEQQVTAAQRAWIKGYVDQFEAALYGANFTDPENGYRKFVDVDSFIDHHIIVELTKNIDGYRLSTFMYKDEGGKLIMGPVWDYNLSLGNANYLNGWIPEGWYYTQLGEGDYPWYGRMFQDPAFVQRYSTRWLAFRQRELTHEKLRGDIRLSADLLEESQARNFQRWRVLGTYIWPNWYIARTYADEITWMSGWLRQRVDWMDSVLVLPPTFEPEGGRLAEGAPVVMSAPFGTVYYTLDGSDPRAADNSVAPAAVRYVEPVRLAANTLVRARTRVNDIWSGVKEAVFVVHTPPLVITEVMYQPAMPPEGSPYSASDFEFIEFQNVGREPLDVRGMRLKVGSTVRFQFSAGSVSTLEPGAYAVAVRNPAAFASRYDTSGILVAGEIGVNLNDRTATLRLEDQRDGLLIPVLELVYRNTWHPSTAGGGHSLVIINPRGDLESWSLEESWRPSLEVHGSPGRADGESGGLQRPGDFNQDGRLNITDASLLLRGLFRGSTVSVPCDGSGVVDGGNRTLLDLDGDGSVTLSDGIYLLNYLFASGPPPALGTGCVEIAGCPAMCR